MYNIDPITRDIVVNHFEQGIGASPYTGLSDMRSVNPDSILGEASVAFSTQSATKAPAITNNSSGSLVTDSTGLFLAPSNLLLEERQWITISNLGGASGTNLSTGKLYELVHFGISGLNDQWQLFDSTGTQANVSVASTTAVIFSTLFPTKPKFFAQAIGTANFMIDDVGNVWTDFSSFTTNGGGNTPATHSWGWTKNTTDSKSHGNGLVYWRSSESNGDWKGWLFVFRDNQIDYLNVNGVSSGVAYSWVSAGKTYQYAWQTGLTGQNLNSCPHNAIVGPDGRVYFCDYYNVRKFYQTDLVTPTTFDPTNAATYTYTTYNLLPIDDIATCIAPLGTGYLIGGILNQAYQWDSTSNLISNPILLAESYVSNIITVNTNAYIFAGNRGYIYRTNGSQADPWAKVPDHISGTIEPYFQWGGATYNKKRLYFSVNAVDNAGSNLSNYGGIWAIDLDTQELWISNELSYGTYTGYASALSSIPSNFNGNSLITVPTGYGLLIGWVNNTTYGIDTTISAPYTNGHSWVTTELIPIGTAIQPTTPSQIEFKLSKPLVSGESIQIKVGQYLDMTYASFQSCKFNSATSFSSAGSFSAITDGMTLDKFQWIIVQVILTSTASSPSYCRLTELRIKNATQPITSYSSLI